MIALWRETRLYGEELCFGSSGCAGVEEVCTASSRKHIKAALWCRIMRFLRKPVNRGVMLLTFGDITSFCCSAIALFLKIHTLPLFFLLPPPCKIQARDVIL